MGQLSRDSRRSPGTHPARRQAYRRPTARDPAASAEPATAPPKATQIATGGAGGRHRRRMPDARRHATLLQSRIQRENWEFETHTSMAGRKRRPIVLMKEMVDDAWEEREKRENPRAKGN